MTVDSQHVQVARLSSLCAGRLYPRSHPYYSFLSEAEWTPGPKGSRKD